ncbi:MAG TPA: NADH-quinone oxidoreductase subunit NuoK [Anaerolineae bacterium]|nr:NADH-quinone oxidoreductase subunit NuoK [Anaerolineae bacterium]
MTIPLSWWVVSATALFSIGLYGVLSNRNAIAILMSLELMLNAVNINLVAFGRYITPLEVTGQIFAIFVIAIAAAEAAVALAIIIAVYRQRTSINVEKLDSMRF